VISHYYFVRRTPDHYLRNALKNGISNLREYLTSGKSDELNNGQVRLISGVGDSVPFGECTPDLLRKAQHNLEEHFSFVGLSERFDESLLLLRNMFGWKIPFYTRKNVTKKQVLKRNITQETLDIIKSYNQLDLQLYEYAKQRFQQELEAQPPSFKEEIQRFKRWNKNYNKLCFIKRQNIDPWRKLLSIKS
jgi:hypothetical protein